MVQPKDYFTGKEPIAVAKLNLETREMEVLPGMRDHLNALVNEARSEDGLSIEKLAAFETFVSTWKDAAPTVASSLKNTVQ